MFRENESPRAVTPEGTKVKNKRVSYRIDEFHPAVNEFVKIAIARGLVLDNILSDGKVHRVPVNEKDRDKSGAYLMFPDAPYNGWVQNFRDGLGITEWSWSGNSRPNNKEERALFDRRVAEARLEHEREKADRDREARRNASGIWENSSPCTDAHPYLARKGVKAHDGLHLTSKGNEIIVPVYDAGEELRSIQFIRPDGTKRFLTGGQIAGCYFDIPGDTSKPVYIAEGYATGATVHAATGASVLCAFNCGNLRRVAQMVRARAGDRRIVIAADNDHATNENPGMTKGREAADAVGGGLVTPLFREPFDASTLDGKGKPKARTDWNDLMLAEGLDVVRAQLEGVKAIEARQGGSQVEPWESDPISAAIQELNKKHAFIMLEGQSSVLNLGDGADGNDSFSSLRSFRERYANRLYSFKGKEVSIAKIWNESPERREYRGMYFKPGGAAPDGFYNSWRGFTVEPRPGTWDRYRDLMRRIICGGNQSVYDYLLAWMANVVQNPGDHDKRPGVAIVMKGRRGTGKGTFARWFGGLFGRHYKHIAEQSLITGRFNAHLHDAVVVFIDEGFFAGDPSAAGKIKGLITERNIMIEGKGVNAFNLQNHMHFLFASNEDWVVPAGDAERRFLVLDVHDSSMQDHAYFTALNDEMKNGGQAALLHELLTHDISAVNLRDAPKTDGLTDQIVRSLDSVGRFWFEALQAGRILSAHSDWEPEVAKTEIHSAYQDFTKGGGASRTQPPSGFFKRLRVMCPEIKESRLGYGDRSRTCRFPHLMSCRGQFSSWIGSDVPWEDGQLPDAPPF